MGNVLINNSNLTTGDNRGGAVGYINFIFSRALAPDRDDLDLKYPRAMLETRISNCEEMFVETQAFRKLKTSLKENRTVVLRSPPGEGKTTMGIMMCKHLMDEGYFPLFYDTLDSVQDDLIAKTKKNVLVVIDDFLGKASFDSEQMEGKKRKLTALNEIQLKIRREMEQSMGSQTANQKLPMLLLMLSRDNVYKQALKTMSDKDKSWDVCSLSSTTYLLPEEKMELLENYSRKKEHVISEDQAEAILKADCPFAFLQMCHLYSVMKSADPDPVQFFQNPKLALKDEMFGMMTEDPKVKAVMTLLLLEEILSTYDLEDTQSEGYKRLTKRLQMIKRELPLPEQFEDMPFPLADILESMCGGLLEKRCGLVAFSHDSVRDAVSMALVNDHAAFMARHCTLDFINKHIRPSEDTGSEPDTIKLKGNQSLYFVRRMVNEVEKQNLKGAFTCPLIQNSQFLSSFIVNLRRSEKIHDVVHYIDESEELCFLFWLSISSPSQLKDFFSVYTFSDEEIWQAICGCCMMGEAHEIEFLHKQLKLPPAWTKPMRCLSSGKSADCSTSSVSRILPSNPGSLAAAHGHAKVLEVLVGLDMPVDVTDSHSRTPLMYASKAGQAEVVDLLVGKHRANPDVSDSSGSKALHFAIQIKNTRTAKSLIQNATESSDVMEYLNKANSQGQTFLMLACSNCPQLARELLILKARTDLKDKDGRSCLHYACCSDDPDLIRELVQTHGMDVNEEDNNGVTPLYQACFIPGNQNVVKALLDVGADPHKKALGATPLHVACACDLETAKVLLQGNLKIDEVDDVHMTPLSYACIFEKPEIVKYLIDMNASVKLNNPDKNTVLHLAARAGSFKVVSCLLEKDPSLVNNLNRASHSPFFEACLLGHIHVAEALKQKKACVDQRDRHGRNVLHEVASTGHMTTIKFLVEQTPLDINSKDQVETTPLMLACFFEVAGVVCYLIEKKADCQARDTWGNTALHYAAAAGKGSALTYSGAADQGNSNPEQNVMLPDKKEVDDEAKLDEEVKVGVIGVLLHENLLHVDEKNEHKNTPMLIACLSGDVTKIKNLIENGADAHATDEVGNTALHHASGKGHLPVLQFLKANTDLSFIKTNNARETPLDVALRKEKYHVIDFLAEQILHERDHEGNSPLHTAAKSGNIAGAERLLNVVKIPVDVRNNAMETPLHCASGAGEKEMVAYLLQKHASTRAKDKDGHLPLHLAVIDGHLATAEVLLKSDPPTIDLACEFGRTPLCHACEGQKINESALAQYFVAEDKSAKHRENGDTSLHVAARKGFMTTVVVLVGHLKMNVDIQNRNKETPLQCARAGGHDAVVDYLIGKTASR